MSRDEVLERLRKQLKREEDSALPGSFMRDHHAGVAAGIRYAIALLEAP
jgi:hypothetical protein